MPAKKAVHITYFVHGTTVDNERHLSSGWYDTELSELGIKQSIELRDKIKGKKFDVVYCSDLKRAVDSAKLTFGDTVEIIQDKRLRECDYGAFTQTKSEEMDRLMREHISKPFPSGKGYRGESYEDVEKRMRKFCRDLLKKYMGKNVAIVAHRAPQLALDVIIGGKTWEQAMREDWRVVGKWQPGWEYILKE